MGRDSCGSVAKRRNLLLYLHVQSDVTRQGGFSIYIYTSVAASSLCLHRFVSLSLPTPHHYRTAVPFQGGGERKGEPIKMQRFVAGWVSQGKHSLRWRRSLSQLAQTNAVVQDSDVLLPTIPPFDYSPPPYDGPSSADVWHKRKQFLSPALCCFYKQPVSLFSLLFFPGKIKCFLDLWTMLMFGNVGSKRFVF